MADIGSIRTIRRNGNTIRAGVLFACAAVACVGAAAQSALVITNPPFPLTPVGQSVTQNVSIAFAPGSSVQPNPVSLISGTGEFTLAPGSCYFDGNVTYTSGSVCTLPITFTPKSPGNVNAPVPIVRAAQLILTDTENGTPQSYTLPITGGGTQAWPVFLPGVISDIVGNDQTPQSGFAGDGGPASGAVFNGPTNMAVDAGGNIYISDTGNCVVRRIDKLTGTVSTFAGTAPSPTPNCGLGTDGVAPTASLLNGNTGIALDAAGDLYIADTGNHVIRVVSAATGLIQTFAGAPGTQGFGGDAGPAASATLSGPMGVAVDGSGNVYIADTGNYIIRAVPAATGIINTVAGIPGQQNFNFAAVGGPALSFNFTNPQAVAVDSSGNLYVADTAAGFIWTVAASTQTVSYIPVPSGSPISLAVDAADVPYFTLQGDCHVYKDFPSQSAMIVAGSGSCAGSGDAGSATAAGLNGPVDAVPDSAGNIYILEADGVRFVDSSGNAGFTESFGGLNIGLTSAPQSLLVANGNVQIPGSPYVNALGVQFTGLTVPFLTTPPSGAVDCSQGFQSSTFGPISVYPGFFCSFAFEFAPTADGSFSSTTGFYDFINGNRAQSFTINLLGTGTGTVPTATLTPASQTFTAIPHETTQTLNFILTNTSSTSPLVVSNISFLNYGTVGYVFGFTQTNNCGASVAAGASCTIQVTFSPTALGTIQQTLIVTDNSAAGTHTAGLTGIGNAPIASVSPGSLTFSTTQPVGTQSATQTVTLSNTGAAPLTLASIKLGGTNPGNFILDASACPTTLPAPPATGSSCNILVSFKPVTSGSLSATLLIDDDSGGQASPAYAEQTVVLTGASPAPAQSSSFTIANNTFPAIAVGQSETQSVSLTLNSTSTVLKSIAIGAGYMEYTVGAVTGCTVDGVTANPGGTVCSIAITFTPSLVGYSRSAPLVVTTIESGKSVPYDFGLTGISNGAMASLTPGVVSAYLAGHANGTAGVSGFGGPATAAGIGALSGQAMDSNGNLYVSDGYYDVIYKIDPSGTLSLFAGVPFIPQGYLYLQSGNGGPALNAHLGYPGQLAVDAAGNVYVAASDVATNSTIRKIDATTGVISAFVGGGNGCSGQTDSYGDGCTGPQYKLSPGGSVQGMAFDAAGNFYFDAQTSTPTGPGTASLTNYGINKLSASTGLVSVFAGYTGTTPGAGGDGGPAVGASITPTAIAPDTQGNILFLDGGLKVRSVSPNGTISTIAGISKTPLTPGFCNQGANPATGDGGLATAAGFGGITGLAVDAANDIYVVDRSACEVRRIDAATGIIHTVTGQNSTYGFSYGNKGDTFLNLYATGSADLASYNSPTLVTLDSNANFYILDPAGVRKIDVSKSVQDFGYYYDYFYSQGNLFYRPTGIGGTVGPLTTTVLNAGNSGALTFQSPFVDPTSFGISTADFTRDTSVADCISTATISPGNECPILNDFTPTIAASPVLATQTVSDSAITSQSISLIGISSGTATLTLLPHLLSFTSAVNVTSASQSFTLTNNGGVSVPITGITLGGVSPSLFSQTNTCGAVLAANSSCNIGVTFTPVALGNFTAQLAVAAIVNGTAQSLTGGLLGLAGRPQAEFLVNLGLGGSNAFGDQNVGTTSSAHTFYLKSLGSIPLLISSITITGSDASQFAITGTTCGSSLAPQATCDVTVTFTPLTNSPTNPATPFTASLTATDDAPNSPQVIVLTGSGIGGEVVPLNINETIHVSDAEVLTPATPLHINETISVSDTNQLTPALSLAISETIHVIDSPSLSLVLPGQTITFTQPLSPVQFGSGPYTLQASASSGLPVTFSVLSGPGSITGNQLSISGLGIIVIAANQSGNSSYAAAPTVQQTVVVELLPVITVFGKGTLAQGSTAASVPITLSFNSAFTLATLATSTLGAPGTDFAVVPGGTCQLNTTYGPGDSCTVNVTFTPTGPGLIVGRLSALDSGGNTQASANLASLRYR